MLLSLDQTISLINQGKVLHIAADESLLDRLPKGQWIAGTTPYFITEKGGMICKDKLFVDEISFGEEYKSVVYGRNELMGLAEDAYANETCFLVLPFASETTNYFAKEAPNDAGLLMVPTIGWVAGFDLSQAGQAKVYDGFTGTSYTDKAVALHVQLPSDKLASVGIINIFDISPDSPCIEFDADTLSVTECRVDGKKVVLADYLETNKINTELPLIADYNGSLINVSIKAVAADKRVELYAPVFAGYEYRFAKAVPDYAASFEEKLKNLQATTPVFSCNCILNYLYGGLEGKSTVPFAGPVTFGEVAYQLLNQTLVYMTILDT